MKIAYIAPALGSLTSTFVYREVEALRKRGYEISTFSTRRPREQDVSQEARGVVSHTDYLLDRPRGRIAAEALTELARRPGPWLRTLGEAVVDAMTARVPAPMDRVRLLWRFVVAAGLAGRLRAAGAEHIHAHFADSPATIAMYGAMMAEIPFSFTCHASDIFVHGTALRQKVNRSRFTACISDFNRQYLTHLGCNPARMHIVRCAINLEDYSFEPPRGGPGPTRILSIGQLVEKKGMFFLLEAASMLRERGLDIQLRVAGEGPLYDTLRTLVAKRVMHGYAELTGGQPQEQIREWMREADMFVLPCVVAESGDRDGIPVVLMEAMAMGTPVVSTTVSGIPELIQHEKSGMLAEPEDSSSLAAAMAQLIADPELAAACARAGRATMEREFDAGLNAERLAALIEGHRKP
jgi:colanic acid/amylovoran biosynthesis glycosyltransferase